MSVLSATTWRILAASLLLSFTFTAAAQSDETTLEERMGEEKFRAAGLHKLSSDELAALEAWLEARDREDGAGQAAAEPETDQRGLEEEDSGRSTIESRIVGTFSGWRGRGTTFELENGMVWRVVDDESFVTSEVENPEVEVRPGAFGTWRLHIEDHRTWARVRRVR